MMSPNKFEKYIPAKKLLNVAIFVFLLARMCTVTPLVRLATLPTPEKYNNLKQEILLVNYKDTKFLKE